MTQDALSTHFFIYQHTYQQVINKKVDLSTLFITGFFICYFIIKMPVLSQFLIVDISFLAIDLSTK